MSTDPPLDPPDELRERFLLLDSDRSALAGYVDALTRLGVDPGAIAACSNTDELARVLADRRSSRAVAFLAWPIEGPLARALVRGLRAESAWIVAMVPPAYWQGAAFVRRDGADDVLLVPCPSEAFAARASFAQQAASRRLPSPWHRARAVLREALAHACGGEIVVRGRAGTARILISGGRIAWVHDDDDRNALLNNLRGLGVDIAADDFANVVQESQRTREHFGEVLARWGLAEREVVMQATRSVIDRRLQRALDDEDAVALFVPSRWPGTATVTFARDELAIPRTTAPPSMSLPRPSHALIDDASLARVSALPAAIAAIAGCTSAAVFHYGMAAVVGAAGGALATSVAWSLGAALDALDDGADAIACSSARCHVARRIPGEPACFAYGEFDLATVSLALARMSLAQAIQRGATTI